MSMHRVGTLYGCPVPSDQHEDHERGEHDHAHDGEHSHEPNHDFAHEHAGGLRGFVASILRPHSHDPADSVDRALTASADGIRAVKVSLVGLGITAAVQLVIVVASGSAALLADTVHNFGDAATAVPLWIAFAISGRAATRRYTYGYGRAEDLAGIFVVLMIAASGAFAGYESVRHLIDPREITNLGWVAAAGVLGLIGNEAVAQYRIHVGERIGSAALIADGYHARTDGFTSLAVVAGAAGVWLGFERADALVGLAITVAILFVLKDAGRQMWRRIMDGVDPEIINAGEGAARGTVGVIDVALVRARWIGHEIHAEARITVDRELPVKDGHEIAEEVERAMMRAVPRLASVIVHVNPCEHSGPVQTTTAAQEHEA